MLHTGCHHQQVSDAEQILLTKRLEDNLPFENVDAHRTIGVVRREVTPWPEGQDRKTKWALFDERSRASPVPGHEGLIDRLLVSRKMADEHLA